MFFEKEMKKLWCLRCHYKLDCEKQKNNVFRIKQTTNNLQRNLQRRFEGKKKVRLMFGRPKYSMESKCYVYSGYKQRRNVCLLYLECKFQQDSYG